jgi:hypothetical protein
MNDYSQYGEGKVINHYFQNKLGTCISLGENDLKNMVLYSIPIDC